MLILGVRKDCRSARRRATPTSATFGVWGSSSSSWQRAGRFPTRKWTSSTTSASAKRSSTTSLLSCQPAYFPLRWATSSTGGTSTSMQPHQEVRRTGLCRGLAAPSLDAGAGGQGEPPRVCGTNAGSLVIYMRNLVPSGWLPTLCKFIMLQL